MSAPEIPKFKPRVSRQAEEICRPASPTPEKVTDEVELFVKEKLDSQFENMLKKFNSFPGNFPKIFKATYYQIAPELGEESFSHFPIVNLTQAKENAREYPESKRAKALMRMFENLDAYKKHQDQLAEETRLFWATRQTRVKESYWVRPQ